MSTKDINQRPKGTTAATSEPVYNVVDTDEVTDDLGGVSLADREEKTPTQAKAARQGSNSDGVLTPTPAQASLAVPASDVLRKTSSTNNLQVSADDDVFGPADATANMASTINTALPPIGSYRMAAPPTSLQTISDRINAGYLSIVPPHFYNIHQPRPDRSLEVTADNAQAVWPADAVVFVANLSAQRTADQLEVSMHQMFDVFGRCEVKIKYDKNKHPFALVAFEEVPCAQEAITKSSNVILDGRPIRLEQGKAERAVILTKHDGTAFYEAEARNILSQFGSIEACFPTYAMRNNINSLPGFYVRFAYYQDCRDALKIMSGANTGFRLQLANGNEQDARNHFVAPLPVPRAVAAPRPAVHVDTDSKSIFVGNLPTGTTKQNLCDIFSEHGMVIDVNVIQKRYDGGSINVFGFVEFSNSDEAMAAAYANDKWFGGKKLRIEAKEYTARRGNRVAGAPVTTIVAPSAPTPARSPRRTPLRLTPSANNALAARLAANNAENGGAVYTPMPTPPMSLLPANLFSPSPGGYGPVGGYGNGGAGAYGREY